MSEPITLFGYATSPYVNKVSTFLNYKGLAHQFTHVRPKTNEAIKFTGQTQVPVLMIGDEWRTDSSPLGHWLDERFPDKPLMPTDPAARETAIRIDDWISDQLIPARFREAVEWDKPLNSTRNGWRLARIVHFGTPLPLAWRVLWPFAVKKAPFIVHMVNALDLSEPIADMRQRMMDELEGHLAGGPYLGGLDAPTIADFSAYSLLITSWLVGMRGSFPWRDMPALKAWMKRVQSHLTGNPIAIDDRFFKRSLEGAWA